MSFSSSDVLRKFRSLDIWIVISILIVLFFLLIAIFAFAISPDKTRNANQMHLSIPLKKSGFKIQMIRVPDSVLTQESRIKTLFLGYQNHTSEVPILGYQLEDKHFLLSLYPNGLKKKVALTKFPKSDLRIIKSEYIYTKTFLLGTDKYGRDILSRLIVGTRVSLSIGLIAMLISFVIGSFMGALSGYFGGAIDTIIMWIINVIWSIPTLLLVMAITLALGKGFWQVFIAVGLTMWVEVARVVRGQFQSIKTYEYIKTAETLGYSNMRIILKHMLPNTFSPLSVILATNFASAILIESGLSFLGLGTQPPVPSWGGMIKQQYAGIIVGRYLSALVPGLCIVLLVTALIFIANVLQKTSK